MIKVSQTKCMRASLILAALPLLCGCEQKQMDDRAVTSSFQSHKDEITLSTLHIEGTASWIHYRTDGTVRASADGRFSLATDFSKWTVKYIDEQNNTVVETTFDGNYTYTLYSGRLPLAEYQADKYRSDPSGPVPNHLIVTNGQYEVDGDIGGMGALREPVALPANARVAWMNLLACGWISNPPAVLIPPWLKVASREASSYKSRLHSESIADRDCCAQIEFVRDDRDAGFVEARFRVLSRTNVQNKCVPLEAELVRFWSPEKQMAKPLRSVITTKVSKHYFSSEAISPPVLSKKTYVTDTRFNTSDGPDFYVLTNKAWPGLEAVGEAIEEAPVPRGFTIEQSSALRNSIKTVPKLPVRFVCPEGDTAAEACLGELVGVFRSEAFPVDRLETPAWFRPSMHGVYIFVHSKETAPSHTEGVIDAFERAGVQAISAGNDKCEPNTLTIVLGYTR